MQHTAQPYHTDTNTYTRTHRTLQPRVFSLLISSDCCRRLFKSQPASTTLDQCKKKKKTQTRKTTSERGGQPTAPPSARHVDSRTPHRIASACIIAVLLIWGLGTNQVCRTTRASVVYPFKPVPPPLNSAAVAGAFVMILHLTTPRSATTISERSVDRPSHVVSSTTDLCMIRSTILAPPPSPSAPYLPSH